MWHCVVHKDFVRVPLMQGKKKLEGVELKNRAPQSPKKNQCGDLVDDAATPIHSCRHTTGNEKAVVCFPFFLVAFYASAHLQFYSIEIFEDRTERKRKQKRSRDFSSSLQKGFKNGD